MKMPPTEELPYHLMEMGAKLKEPPEDLSKRSELLDDIEGLLSRMSQRPSFPVSHALVPIKEGLIAESNFGSSDDSVKITSLACIHELIRISAPDQAYEDDRMKEIFKETVKAFEQLSSGSGRYFQKARSMLYNVANVRSGLILLDLGCESLVAQLFQIFLRDTRSDYPAEVVSDMEDLMTRLIMEADKLSVDLLRPLVMSIGAENQVKSPPSARLGMKVLQNCSTIVQPFLQTVIEQLKRDLEACSQAVFANNVRQEAVEDGSGPAIPDSSGSGAMENRTRDEVFLGRKRSLPRKLVKDYVIPEDPRRRKRERRTRRHEENEVREELIGSRIKVWWPDDQVYYEGTVSSYDPTRKRHTVVYVDGDVESLRLSQERWSLVHGTSTIQGVRIQEPTHPDASSSHVPVDEAEKENTRDKGKQKEKDGASSSTKRPYRRVQCCNAVVID